MFAIFLYRIIHVNKDKEKKLFVIDDIKHKKMKKIVNVLTFVKRIRVSLAFISFPARSEENSRD
jgi:hypothetical protein